MLRISQGLVKIASYGRVSVSGGEHGYLPWGGRGTMLWLPSETQAQDFV